MCLAIPGTILSISGAVGVVDYGGLEGKVELTLVPEAKVGDHVIVHAGFAIAIMEQEEAEELIKLTAETRQYE